MKELETKNRIENGNIKEKGKKNRDEKNDKKKEEKSATR